jgi:hypothetical protein
MAAPNPSVPDAPDAPALAYAFEARVDVGPIIDVGEVIGGRRRVIPILGGAFEGPRLRGRVLPGADWQVVHNDTLTELVARYLLETDSGSLVAIVNRGLRHASPEVLAQMASGETVDPSLVYFRTVATFESADPSLAWLTRSIVLGSGERQAAQVVIRFWTVS